MKQYILIEKHRSKKCTKCNELFPATLDFFYKNKTKLRPDCKKCLLKIKKTYDISHRKEQRDYEKIYRENNKNKIKNYRTNYRQENRIYTNEYNKKYYYNNRVSVTKKRKKYHKFKMETDPLYKIKTLIRQSIKISINRKGFTKKSKTYKILGCTFEEFKVHIEGRFEPWMNWDNHGLYNGEFNFGWDLDHIIPVSSALIEEDVIKLNHYTNFQPLCSKVNRDIKRDTVDFV